MSACLGSLTFSFVCFYLCVFVSLNVCICFVVACVRLCLCLYYYCFCFLSMCFCLCYFLFIFVDVYSSLFLFLYALVKLLFFYVLFLCLFAFLCLFTFIYLCLCFAFSYVRICWPHCCLALLLVCKLYLLASCCLYCYSIYSCLFPYECSLFLSLFISLTYLTRNKKCLLPTRTVYWLIILSVTLNDAFQVWNAIWNLCEIRSPPHTRWRSWRLKQLNVS